MSKANFVKISTQADKLYMGENGKNYTPIEKTYKNESAWVVLSQYDKANTNKANANNEQLDAEELKAFKNDLKKADTDGNNSLDDKELSAFAKLKKVSVDALKKAINFVSSELLLKDVADTFHPGLFSSVDKDKAKQLLEYLNKDNFSLFAASIHDGKAGYGEKYPYAYNITKDLFTNFSKFEASKIMLKIVKTAQQAAKDKNIPINDLLGEYNKAVNAKNVDDMKKTVTKILARFGAAFQLDSEIYNFDNNPNGDAAKITTSHEKNIKEIANDYNIGNTKDIVGDGIIGNTKSKSISGTKSKLILSALNELLSDPKYRNQIQSNYKKENHVMVVYSPKRRVYTTSEDLLVQNKEIYNGTIGDGDTSAMVAALKRWMTLDNFKPSNVEQMKKYIIDVFSEENL